MCRGLYRLGVIRVKGEQARGLNPLRRRSMHKAIRLGVALLPVDHKIDTPHIPENVKGFFQSMLRAYRLIITNNPYAPENLWETEQPYIATYPAVPGREGTSLN